MAPTMIDIKPISGSLGAEIIGPDLSQGLSDQEFTEIHQAFLDHKVLRFPEQDLTPDRQVEFARLFGQSDVYPFIKNVRGFSEVIEILETPGDTVNSAGGWHSDIGYLEKLALGSMLYALEVPTTGGDTMFYNMNLAYESLSAGMKHFLSQLTGVNSSAQTCQGDRSRRMKELEGMRDKYIGSSAVPVAEHPVVWTHPETGKKSLYVSRAHTSHFKGMTKEESRPLIEFLSDHATRPEFTCRMRWKPGMLMFWDNRSTQHFAVNGYNGQCCRMHRVTLVGDRPV